MALIDSNTLLVATGTFANFFAQMSTGINNFISIVKAPIQNIINPNETVLPGYNPASLNINDITYSTVTGVYPALIIYPHQLQNSQFGQLKFTLDDNQIMIKVEETTKNYLLNGKTEKIIANEIAYNMELTPSTQNFFGLKYYYFKLTSTK